MNSRRERRGRRTRLLLIASGAAVLVTALVALSGCGNGNGDSEDVEVKSVAETNTVVKGIPQEGMLLGNPEAPVELVEYCDLQSSDCKEYWEDVLSPTVKGRVENGEVSLTFRNNVFISDKSISAGAAMLAAAEQGLGWNFQEAFYLNQGEALFEPFVTEEFIEAVGKATGIPNFARWNKRRKSKDLKDEVEATTAEAERLKFIDRTASFTTTSRYTNGPRIIGRPAGPVSMEERINEALSGNIKPLG